MTNRRLIFWLGLAAVLFVSRVAHLNILWADEDYHLAVAQQLLHGKMLYRDVWYDKPPLNALVLALIGGQYGWPLRLISTLLELGGAAAAFRFARSLWGEREGYLAAAAFAFFHIFFFPATAIPLEPDSLMILPHILALYFAWKGQPVRAGILAATCFLLNSKGAFVVLACVILLPAQFLWIALGFALPCLATIGWLYSGGALADFWRQVWEWGFVYARNPLQEPASAPLLRLAGWFGFHVALWIGAAFGLRRLTDPALRWKLAAWLGLSLLAALVGWRMPPRYMSQMFPALILLGSGGLAMIFAKRTWWTLIAVIALLVPMVRFGPRYGQLLAEDARGVAHNWDNVVMDQESRVGGAVLRHMAQSGDTIYIWGYRPNLVVYSGLPIASQLWDSQPVTMVPADRHLGRTEVLNADWARQYQEQLVQTRPTFIVDGLSAYNPGLDIHKFPRLADWLKQYCESGQPGPGLTIYRRCER